MKTKKQLVQFNNYALGLCFFFFLRIHGDCKLPWLSNQALAYSPELSDWQQVLVLVQL